MWLSNTFTKWLWDARRSLAVWTVAISAVGGMYAAFWPTINDPDMQELLESYPEGILEALNYDDVSTSAGYLTASVYGLLGAILLLVYATAAGARTLAGDEESGTLELIAAHPISRVRLALQRFGALVASLFQIVAGFWLVMLVLRRPSQLDDISIGGFVAMHLHLGLFGALFGALAFAVGAATGRRAFALGTGAAVAVLGFLANGLLPQINGLEWVRNISPFHWLVGGDPLRNGIDLSDTLIMSFLTAALVAAGTWAFDRRDITV